MADLKNNLLTCRQLIEKGEIQKALSLVDTLIPLEASAKKSDLLLLVNRFNTNEKNYIIDGIISREDYSLESNKITLALITILNNEASTIIDNSIESKNFNPINENNRIIDLGNAPDILHFYGRNDELSILQQWVIKEKCKIVSIIGMKGIGKTMLMAKFGMGGIGKTDLSLKFLTEKNTRDEFDVIIWRSLMNAPPLSELLTELLKTTTQNKEIETTENDLVVIQKLIKVFNKKRCLVILDNFETILSKEGKSNYISGYDSYGLFLNEFGSQIHNSCMIITSREKPFEIWKMEGLNTKIKSMILHGLGKENVRSIFENIGDFISTDEELESLIERFNGNPLVLQLVGRHVHEIYFGNLSDYLAESEPLFHDLRALLDWHFDRLTVQEKEILFWLAINREYQSVSDFRKDIFSPERNKQIPSTLQSLSRKIPLERKNNGFLLQPVLIEFLTEKIVSEATAEVIADPIYFLLDFCLCKATSKDYIRETQDRLIVQPVVEQLAYQVGVGESLNKLIKNRLNSIDRTQRSPNYFAGNLLNILRHCTRDFSNIDLSRLFISQANFQGLTLHKTDLGFSILKNCIFTQAFGTISSIALNHSSLFVTAHGNGDIRIWDWTNFNQEAIIHGHSDWIWKVAFSNDKKKFASCSQDKTVKIWDAETFSCTAVLNGHEDWVKYIVFSRDSNLLISCGNDGKIIVWDTVTGTAVRTLTAHIGWVWSLDVSKDDQYLLSSGQDGKIIVWELLSGNILNVFDNSGVTVKQALFINSKQIVSIGFDNRVKIWDLKTITADSFVLATFKEILWNASYDSENENLIVAGDDGLISVISLKDLETKDKIIAQQGRIWALDYNLNREVIGFSSGNQSYKIYSSSLRKTIKTFRGFTNTYWTVARSVNSKMIITGSSLGIQTWYWANSNLIIESQNDYGLIRKIIFLTGDRHFASTGDDGIIRLWDSSSSNLQKELFGHTNRVWALSYSPVKNLLLSGGEDHKIIIWDLLIGKIQNIIDLNHLRIWDIKVHPSRMEFVCGTDDAILRVFNLETGQLEGKMIGHEDRIWSLQFSPDGAKLASAGADGNIILWDAEHYTTIKKIKSSKSAVWILAFVSPKLVACAGADCIIRIWDIDEASCLYELHGHKGVVTDLSYIEEDNILISCSLDETIHLWDLSNGQSLSQIKTVLPYQDLNLSGVTGITPPQREMLIQLGASDR